MKKSNIEIGISTASLFMREYGEDAVVTLQALDSRITEMFFETFPEYEEEFARLVRSRSGDLGFHSVHVYTMHYEPELFSLNERSYGVAEATFRKVLTNAKILGAGNYTMHGRARMKKSGFYDDYAFIGKRLDKLCGIAREYGVTLCLENVEWAFYNRVGFFKEVSKYAQGLGGVFDIKQARLSGDKLGDYISEMGEKMHTVHLSDVDENGRIRLPSDSGLVDFEDVFKRLKDAGFSGNMLIEVYSGDYGEIAELKRSLDYLREKKYKIFG